MTTNPRLPYSDADWKALRSIQEALLQSGRCAWIDPQELGFGRAGPVPMGPAERAGAFLLLRSAASAGQLDEQVAAVKAAIDYHADCGIGTILLDAGPEPRPAWAANLRRIDARTGHDATVTELMEILRGPPVRPGYHDCGPELGPLLRQLNRPAALELVEFLPAIEHLYVPSAPARAILQTLDTHGAAVSFTLDGSVSEYLIAWLALHHQRLGFEVVGWPPARSSFGAEREEDFWRLVRAASDRPRLVMAWAYRGPGDVAALGVSDAFLRTLTKDLQGTKKRVLIFDQGTAERYNAPVEMAPLALYHSHESFDPHDDWKCFVSRHAEALALKPVGLDYRFNRWLGWTESKTLRRLRTWAAARPRAGRAPTTRQALEDLLLRRIQRLSVVDLALLVTLEMLRDPMVPDFERRDLFERTVKSFHREVPNYDEAIRRNAAFVRWKSAQRSPVRRGWVSLEGVHRLDLLSPRLVSGLVRRALARHLATSTRAARVAAACLEAALEPAFVASVTRPMPVLSGSSGPVAIELHRRAWFETGDNHALRGALRFALRHGFLRRAPIETAVSTLLEGSVEHVLHMVCRVLGPALHRLTPTLASAIVRAGVLHADRHDDVAAPVVAAMVRRFDALPPSLRDEVSEALRAITLGAQTRTAEVLCNGIRRYLTTGRGPATLLADHYAEALSRLAASPSVGVRGAAASLWKGRPSNPWPELQAIHDALRRDPEGYVRHAMKEGCRSAMIEYI